MKQIVLFLMAAMVAASSMTSCKSAKAPVSGEVEVKKPESIKKAEEKPAIRDWGDGTSFKMSTAKSLAENQARAAFTRKIKAIVQSATRDYNKNYEQGHSDGTNSSLVKDENIMTDNQATTVAENVLTNIMVCNTDIFQQPDKQYHVYVCVEYNGSIADMANSLAKQVGQQVSDEQRVRMQYEQEKFQEAIDAKLKEYKGQ